MLYTQNPQNNLVTSVIICAASSENVPSDMCALPTQISLRIRAVPIRVFIVRIKNFFIIGYP